MPPAERVSGADLMQFAIGDGGTSTQVGAVLVLRACPGAGVADAKRLLAERIRLIPRFRQQLYQPPHGRGRPYWADSPAFDALAHISDVPCPPPGDDRALLDLAAERLTAPLPAGRPPWSATFVTGLTRGRTELVIVVDHVMADGIAGLTVLAAVAGALRDMLAARGEQLREVTISVLVSARSGTSGGELGNQVGVMPVTAPRTGTSVTG